MPNFMANLWCRVKKCDMLQNWVQQPRIKNRAELQILAAAAH